MHSQENLREPCNLTVATLAPVVITLVIDQLQIHWALLWTGMPATTLHQRPGNDDGLALPLTAGGAGAAGSAVAEGAAVAIALGAVRRRSLNSIRLKNQNI